MFVLLSTASRNNSSSINGESNIKIILSLMNGLKSNLTMIRK